jgi:hypothetical protein
MLKGLEMLFELKMRLVDKGVECEVNDLASLSLGPFAEVSPRLLYLFPRFLFSSKFAEPG